MTEMDVRSGWVQPEFDPEWPALLLRLRQLALECPCGQAFHRVPGQERSVGGVIGHPGQCYSRDQSSGCSAAVPPGHSCAFARRSMSVAEPPSVTQLPLPDPGEPPKRRGPKIKKLRLLLL